MNILFITAHCDDAELWAGGTILKYASDGCKVFTAISNHDDTRLEEAMAGAKVLGSQVLFRDSKTKEEDWLFDIISQVKPQALFTHQKEDPHKDHRALYESAVSALTASKERRKYPQRWYQYDSYYSSAHPVGCPIIIDITSYFEIKCKALRCHASQNTEQLVKMALHMDALHGMKIRSVYGEAFYPFALLGRWPILRKLP